MSQEQPRHPEEKEAAVKYGDIFMVSGKLADKPIKPGDAAMMQTAEACVFGQTQKGGPAAAMQAAAAVNEIIGLVGHEDITDSAVDKGVTVTATDYSGARIVTESVAGEVVGQYYQALPRQQEGEGSISAAEKTQITIGETTAHIAGKKAVDQSDAAAMED